MKTKQFNKCMNKIIIKNGLWLFMCLTTVLGFSSCDNEEITGETLTTPVVKLLYSTNASYETFIKNGDVLEYILRLNVEESSDGVVIDKVDYYWDDNLMTTAMDSDHKFSVTMENQALGEHTFRAEVHCSGKGYANMTLKLTRTFCIVDEYPVINFIAEHPETISNGETFTCSVREDEKNTLDVSITKVTYYWDREKLIETSMSPYLLSYAINGVSAGEHLLQVAVSVSGGWNGTITYPYKITVN